MTAIACLRILVALPEAGGALTGPQVQVVADLYLRQRWTAPRRYGAVAPLAFVLADIRAERLDPVEMQALAVELEAKLFPGRAAGQVCLLTFEGDETAVLQFASLSQAQLAGLIAGRGYDGAPGHVQVITAAEIRAVPSAQGGAAAASAKPAAVAKPAPAKPAAPAVKAPPPPATGWWGLYHLPTDAFVGAVIGLRIDLERPRPTDDSALLARDLNGLNDAQGAFAKVGPTGALFVPFSFWNLTTPSSLEAYKRRLSRYPMLLKDRLGATIYDTPREPSLGTLGQIRAFLQPTFSFIDLNISEPNFPVATLPGELVTSLTLSLPDEAPRLRLEAIGRFAEIQGSCRAKGVRQAVSGVRDSAELEACRAAGLRFVCGPAITGLMTRPLGAAPAGALPLKAA